MESLRIRKKQLQWLLYKLTLNNSNQNKGVGVNATLFFVNSINKNIRLNHFDFKK